MFGGLSLPHKTPQHARPPDRCATATVGQARCANATGEERKRPAPGIYLSDTLPVSNKKGPHRLCNGGLVTEWLFFSVLGSFG
jgi:hypothetical protein